MACHLLGPGKEEGIHFGGEHLDAIVFRQVVEDVGVLQFRHFGAEDVDVAERGAAGEGGVVDVACVHRQGDGLQFLAVGEASVGQHGVANGGEEFVEILNVGASEPVPGGSHFAEFAHFVESLSGEGGEDDVIFEGGIDIDVAVALLHASHLGIDGVGAVDRRLSAGTFAGFREVKRFRVQIEDVGCQVVLIEPFVVCFERCFGHHDEFPGGSLLEAIGLVGQVAVRQDERLEVTTREGEKGTADFIVVAHIDVFIHFVVQSFKIIQRRIDFAVIFSPFSQFGFTEVKVVQHVCVHQHGDECHVEGVDGTNHFEAVNVVIVAFHSVEPGQIGLDSQVEALRQRAGFSLHVHHVVMLDGAFADDVCGILRPGGFVGIDESGRHVNLVVADAELQGRAFERGGFCGVEVEFAQTGAGKSAGVDAFHGVRHFKHSQRGAALEAVLTDAAQGGGEFHALQIPAVHEGAVGEILQAQGLPFAQFSEACHFLIAAEIVEVLLPAISVAHGVELHFEDGMKVHVVLAVGKVQRGIEESISDIFVVEPGQHGAEAAGVVRPG